jgi:transcriptional regulator with XRE-family HTH domain
MKTSKKPGKAVKKELQVFLYTVGDNLYNLRMEKKESLKRVAKAVKISPAKLSKLEKGLCPQCRIGVLFRLAEYFKINTLDIVTKGKF